MKRLNLKLLIGLLVTSAVVIATAYTVHRVQMKRNSKNFIIWADRALKEGNKEDEVHFLGRYMLLDPKNATYQARYATALTDLAESQKTSPARRLQAVSQLNKALRLDEKNIEVRDRLATLLMRDGRATDAIQQLERLHKMQTDNVKLAEIEKRLFECHVGLDNLVAAEEDVRAGIAHNPKDISLHERLFGLYSQKKKDTAGALKILNEMVEANPESWEAYLRRFQYRAVSGVTDEVRADLEKALTLGPTQLQVLLAAAERATNDSDFEKGREYLRQAAKAHPDSKDVFIAFAQLDRFAGQTDLAMTDLEDGLKKHVDDPSMTWMLAEMKIRSNQLDVAKDLIDNLEKQGIPSDRLDFLRSQILMQSRQWADALVVLNRIRPQLAPVQGFQEQIDAYRGLCYRSLGQTDQEITVLKQRLLADPTGLQARGTRLELARAMMATGQLDESLRELTDLVNTGDPTAEKMLFQGLLTRNMKLPEEQRNWSVADQLIDKMIERNPDNSTFVAMKVEYLAKKGQVEAAQQLLNSVRDKISKDAVYWLAQADVASILGGANGGPAAGLKVLDDAEKAIGEKPEFRLARISLYGQMGGDEGKKALLDIAANLQNVPEAERTGILQSVALAMYSLSDFDQSKKLYLQLAESNPKDLGTQLMVFSVARDANDEAAMKASVAKIREIAGEDNSYALFCDAARIVSLVQQKVEQPSALAEAQALVEKAALQRPNWGALMRLRGEIYERQSNHDLAIESYQRALDLGEINPMMVRHLGALLLSKNRANELKQVVEKVPNARQYLGTRLVAIIDLIDGNAEDSVVAAKQAAAEDPDSYATQLWLASMLKNAGDLNGAEAAYKHAAELSPETPETWMALARFYADEHRIADIQPVLKDIEAKVNPEQRELALGACQELAKEFDGAEKHYLAALAAKPKDLSTIESVTNFYIRRGNGPKIAEYVNLLMKEGEKAPADQQLYVQRARRTIATLTADAGTADAITKAIQIVDANAKPGKPLAIDDLSLKAAFYARMGDAASRNAAIGSLQELLKREPDRFKERLLLAQLFERDNKWRESKETMRELLAQRGDSENVSQIISFVDMLLRHNETAEAESWLERLRALDLQREPAFLAMQARLFQEQKKPTDAIELLRSQITRPVPANELPLLKRVGDQLVELGRGTADAETYNTAAEALYREYMTEVPAEGFALANFQGQYRDLASAFATLQATLKDGGAVDRAARVGLGLLRTKPEQVNEKLLALEDDWLKQSLAASPDSIELLLLVADLRDVQGNYADAVATYRALLKRTDVTGTARVAALNNLAFILAVKEKKGDEALPMIEEAIKAAGPASELLDTRGVVQLARGKNREALVDLSNAVSSNPSMLKYFHLAQAHLAVEDRTAAADFFERAQNAGLNAATVPVLEKDQFERLRRELPSQSASARS